MKLNIRNEWSNLSDVVVCLGTSIPDYSSYSSDNPEFTKYHKRSWDKKLFIKQQENFFKKLEAFGVKVHLLETDPKLHWQAYTRDTAFVVGNRIFYSLDRGWDERKGEVDQLLKLLKKLAITDIVEIAQGQIDGGDVLVDENEVLVGDGSRSSPEAINTLLSLEKGRMLPLGDNVMHLDTRLTLLPNNFCLIYPNAFQSEDLAFIQNKLKCIFVLEEELMDLGTNVFMVNEETIFSPNQNSRINDELKKAGFKVETVDYTEPINLGGSFRCTTLPLVRK